MQKEDKGNTVIIFKKQFYNEKMRKLLHDTTKFESLEI